MTTPQSPSQAWHEEAMRLVRWYGYHCTSIGSGSGSSGQSRDEALAALSAHLSARPQEGQAEAVGPTYRHIKSGGLYEMVAHAVRESDLAPMAVYRSLAAEGQVWIRPLGEFYDGRFEPAAQQSPPAHASSPPSREWYAAKIRETLDDDFSIGPALTQPPPPAQAPEGWKLVPVEPTRNMLLAHACNCDGLDPESAADDWAAMLAASPGGVEPEATYKAPPVVCPPPPKPEFPAGTAKESMDLYPLRQMLDYCRAGIDAQRRAPLYPVYASEPASSDRKGAERYALLREKVYIDPEQKILRIADIYLLAGSEPLAERLDAAIDAAMNPQEPT